MDRDVNKAYDQFTRLMPHKEDLEKESSQQDVEMRDVTAAERGKSSITFSEQNLRELETTLITSDAFKEARTFRPLLKKMAQTMCSTPSLQRLIDLDNVAHQHGLLFLLLCLLARHAHSSAKPGVVDIQLSPFVRFYLKYLEHKPEVLLEDNPGMDEHQFWEFKADYPLHTLSPVTPNPNFPPQIFQSFVETVQKLSPQEFYSLCAACVSSPLLSIDAESALDDPRTEKFLDLLENADPTNVVKKVLTEDAKLLFSDLGQYTTAISEHPVALKPGNKIPFNREGLADYTPREDIPECSHAAGNFASALVKFMNIFDTRLHDGNCSINAFLIGLLGHDVEDKRKVPLEQLYKHVRDFRSKVVEYVKQNKEELTEKFGEDAVASLTETYDNMERPEWTSSIVWECAANIYKRPIVVYGCPFKPNDPFLIDEKGEIAPSAIFQPKKEQQGPPINLMHVEVHYLYLERR